LSMNTAATEPVIGVINAGSSSVKFSFYEGERRILAGQVDGIGAHPSASATGPNGEKLDPPDLGTKPPTVPSEVLPAILPWAIEKLGDRRLDALGHRVVRSAPLPAPPGAGWVRVHGENHPFDLHH
jgi:acetate kinase